MAVKLTETRRRWKRERLTLCHTLSVTDLAYIAGLFDGEGCIWTTLGKSGTVSLGMKITNTDRPVMEWIRAAIGAGWFICDEGTNREVINWTISGYGAVELLRFIRPFLKIKAALADIAIKWDGGDNELRAQIRSEISKINNRYRRRKNAA